MEFKINHVMIENFRCFEKIDTDLWESVLVEGSNESGKSTFASAILWVLTGKNVEGESTFEIVPTGKYGKVSPSVLLECTIGEKPVSLKREYKAKFTRDKNFSDYAVTTYINGIETGVRKFQDWITSNICNEQVFKILSNPKTFVEDCPKETKELMWQAQRRLLMKMIGGDKTDLEVARENEEWSILEPHFLRYDSASQFLTYLKKQYAELQKQLDFYDTRVELQERNIVPVQHTMGEIEQLVAEVKKNVAKLKAENEMFKRTRTSERAESIKAEIASLTAEKESLMEKYREDQILYERTKQAYQAKADELKSKCEQAMQTIKTYAEALEKLKAVKVVEVCETCGQRLDEASIKRSKAKLQERIKNGNAKTTQLSNEAARLRKEWEGAIGRIKTLMEPVYPSKADLIQSKIEELTNTLASIPEGQNVDGFDSSMQEYESMMDTLREEYFNAKKNKEFEDKVAELENEHKEQVRQLSETQMLMDKTKAFVSAKCKNAEDSINEMFKNVSFQLFEQNKSNDDVRETCILRYRGVKYDDLSYSTKIIAGLEVVKAFQRFYNVTAPVFIDNAESITGDVETGAQTFFMKVREELCPECSGQSGRRNADGTWTCKKCGHVWKKKLSVMEA